MASAEVRSTGDTTFLLEQHTPEPTPITETKPALMTEANPIEQAKKSISSADPPLPPSTTVATEPSPVVEKRVKTSAVPAPSTTTTIDTRDMVTPNPAPSTTTSSDRHDMVCPDPTAHRDTKLQEQASSAALYVTKPAKNVDPRDGLLDADNKLSSRSAAASLKYANPRDLPSYPVVGIDTRSSANAAANLANSGHKQFEHWKPVSSSSAGAAAMAAKDYKMAPMWKPELSAAGSKAALLAHKDGAKLNLWQPEATPEGNSAAGIALRNKTLSPKLDYGYTDDGRKKALVAATGAIGRSQSLKSPPTKLPQYPDAANSAHNALNAATVAHKPSTKSARSSRQSSEDPNRINSDAMRAARVQNMGSNVPREMFSSTPPVDIEVEEKKKQAALRASAISMAKQIYDQSEKRRKEEEAAELQERLGTSAATVSHNRAPSVASTQPDIRQQAMQYIHLQEAAQKLAHERLEKMDPDGVARYRAHYGYEQQSPRNRLSIRGRRRAESNPNANQKQDDDDSSSDDELRSRRIRHQMSSLNNSVAQQDQKRTQDRAALLAAAERKVQAQMHNMDERVFQETGKVTPAMMDDWEAKARARAAADSENRQRNFGKVNIGGGKYMDQSELEAIAQSRLQPTLTEINDTAEKKRARDEEIRLDQEERRRQQMSEKEREKEVKAETKRLKEQEKAEAKAARRTEKELEKNRKAEEKQARKEEKRRSKDVKREVTEATSASAAAHQADKPATTGITATTERDVAVEDVEADPTAGTRTEAAEEAVTPTDGAPLEKTDSPDLMTRVTTGGTTHSTASGLRPELDRHITTVVSSSSSSSISSLSDSSDEEHAHPVAAQSASAQLVSAQPASVQPVLTQPEPTSSSTAATTATSAPIERRKSSRISGLFSRFKRNSKAAGAEPETANTTNVPTSETKAPLAFNEPSSTTAGTTAATTATATTAVAAPAALDTASESSFRRHDTDLHSISSLSSDEPVPAARPTARRGRSSISALSGEEEFEEARDTFDESLAPPPSFGGQPKSQSPVRETRFQEEF